MLLVARDPGDELCRIEPTVVGRDEALDAAGAQAAEVRWLFLKTGAWVISGGVVLGVPAALVVGRLLQTTYVRTEARDVVTLTLTIALLAIVALAAYAWPGNVRELQNVLASMLVSAPRSGSIKPSALPMHIARAAALERSATLADARRQFDERYIRAALAKAGGHTVAAARELGLSRQGLTKLMGRLGIVERQGSADAPQAE